MESAPKKGMSKGCLVGLIVGLALVAIAVIAAVVIWFYWDDLLKTGVTSTVNEVKIVLANDVPEGVDTVSFNALADAYVEKVNEEVEVSSETLGLVVQQFTGFAADKKIDADEVEASVATFLDAYPELEELWTPAALEEPAVPEDSLSTE
jgi:hypothetical protein